LEQEEYSSEGVDWTYIEFVDNKDCLELLTQVFSFSSSFSL